MLIVKPAVLKDCHTLAPLLRKADLDEIEAASGSPPLEALVKGFHKCTPHCYTAFDDRTGIPCGMAGAGPGWNPKEGIFWLLGSSFLVSNRKQFLNEAKLWLGKMHEVYPLLLNMVHAKNLVHIRWLKWLGCEFGPSCTWGPLKETFIYFQHHV